MIITVLYAIIYSKKNAHFAFDKYWRSHFLLLTCIYSIITIVREQNVPIKDN